MPASTAPLEGFRPGKRRWMLGRYLQFVALLQLALYAAITLDRSIVLLYFDPRLALTRTHSARAR